MDTEINSPRASTNDDPDMSSSPKEAVNGIVKEADDSITYRLPETDYHGTTEVLDNPMVCSLPAENSHAWLEKPTKPVVVDRPLTDGLPAWETENMKGGRGVLPPPRDFQREPERMLNTVVLDDPIRCKYPVRSSYGFKGASVRSSKYGHFANGADWASGALVHGGRHVSRFSRHFSSTKSTYCHEEAIEFQQKTDLHLSALMEFISNTAREASILKECWSKLSSQRLSFCQEREEHFQEFEELIEQLTSYEYDNSCYREELIEKISRIETLDVELKTVRSELSSYKKRVSEREQDIEILRHELRSSEEKYMRRSTEYQSIQTELEMVKQATKDFMNQQSSSSEETVEEFKSEVTNVTRERNELRSELRELTIKHESARRDITSLRDRLREVEIERNEMSSELIRVREEFRSFTSQQSESKEEVRKTKKKEEESRRQVTSLEETVRSVRTSLSSSQTEVYKLTEQIKHVERERETVVHNSTHQASEITELQEKISIVHSEVRTLTESRSELRRELERCRYDLEQYQYRHQHGMECFNVKHGSFEAEIERLLKSVREARAEKDLAIGARNVADRERDQANVRYEKKCRELERFEEQQIRGKSRYSFQNHHNGTYGGLTRRMVSAVEPSREISFNETELKHAIDDEIEEGGEDINGYEVPTAEAVV